MTEWTTYHLTPKVGSGFHFGLRGLEQEDSAAHCPSDTLFAALVATLADLDGEDGVRTFTAPFEEGQPPFLLTSVFPRAGGLCLLPFPHVRVIVEPQPGLRKTLKRLRYVSPGIFRPLAAAEPMDAYVDGTADEGAFLQDGRVWLTERELGALPPEWQTRAPEGVRKRDDWYDWLQGEGGRQWLRGEKVWGAQPVDRVAVDRVSGASSVYRIGRTVYAPGCGLWVGVQWPDGVDGEQKEGLERLLTHLGDRGLGGERSVGYGQFTFEEAGTELELPVAEGNPLLTLARYLPRERELPGALRGQAAYRLDAVGGWLGAPGQRAQRRREVRLLTEGSVFEPVGGSPWGRLADVRPEGWDAHPIWRYGYACPVGTRLCQGREGEAW